MLTIEITYVQHSSNWRSIGGKPLLSIQAKEDKRRHRKSGREREHRKQNKRLETTKITMTESTVSAIRTQFGAHDYFIKLEKGQSARHIIYKKTVYQFQRFCWLTCIVLGAVLSSMGLRYAVVAIPYQHNAISNSWRCFI